MERLSYGYAKSASRLEEAGARSTRARARPQAAPRASTTPASGVLRSVAHASPATSRSRPNNVGPKTIPDYDEVANQAITELPGGGKVFAGPA